MEIIINLSGFKEDFLQCPGFCFAQENTVSLTNLSPADYQRNSRQGHFSGEPESTVVTGSFKQDCAFNIYILQGGLKQMRKPILILMIMLITFVLCGCLSRMPFMQKTEKQKALWTGMSASPAVADYREPFTGPVSPEEAMARTLLYTYSRRLAQMQTALSETPFSTSDPEAMERLAISAGYGQDTRPGALFSDQKISALVYPGGDRTDRLASAWNILDFGLSFAVDRQGGTEPLSLSESTRQKVIRNIVAEVRQVYYQTVIAETLRRETETLLGKARDFLRHYREKPALTRAPSREELEKQRQLVETVRFLWDLSQKMAGTKAELAVLMGMNPGTPFQITGCDWKKPNFLPSDKSMTDAELLALFQRAELQHSGSRTGTGVHEIRKAIQSLRQEVSFDAGYDRENPFQQAAVWQDAGLQAARQLFAPVPASGIGQAAQNAESVRHMNLSMAVVSQLHLSRQRYVLAVEEYRIAQDLAEVNRKLNLPAADLPDEFAQIQNETEGLMARMRYYLAFAEVENAAGRFYDSVGIGRFPPNMVSMNIASLTASIQQSLRQQPEILRQSHAPMPAKPATVPHPQDSAVTGARDAKPGQDIFQKGKSLKSPDSDKEDRLKRVVNAAEVESEKRQPVREITVFRDVVSIHSGPSNDSPVKGQGLIGEKYRLTGWAPNGWLKIEMGDGSPGWIPTKYVRPVENAPGTSADTVPQKSQKKSGTSPAQSKTPGPGQGQKVTETKAPPKVPSALRPAAQGQKMVETTARANVRSAPSLQSPVLYIEEQGRQLPVVSSAGEWFKVKTQKGDGWLHRSVIKLLSE